MTLILVILAAVIGVLTGIIIGAGLVTWISRRTGMLP